MVKRSYSCVSSCQLSEACTIAMILLTGLQGGEGGKLIRPLRLLSYFFAPIVCRDMIVSVGPCKSGCPISAYPQVQ